MRVARPAFASDLPSLMMSGAEGNHGVLASGLRRSYGDGCINDGGSLIETIDLDRFVRFDRVTGFIEAEAGISLNDILQLVVPAGFTLPVTPGTKFATLGGAVANDVHGKNHHVAGTIGRWIRQLVLLGSDGIQRVVGPDDKTGLFAATIGGLGLTGFILRVTLELKPIASSQMDVETIRFRNLDEFFALAADSEASHDYTVAWVDCLATGSNLGRGIFTRARHCSTGELQAHAGTGPTMPIDAPGFLLNRLTLSAFNELYYRLAGRPGRKNLSYDPYFYPLDAIGGWNRLYGRRGFFQYQSVVPPSAAKEMTALMLQAISNAGQGSFLAVLKTFGDVASPGLLSFPMKGTTLALDFANRGLLTIGLLDRLDAIVRDAGGRLYPAKDSRLPADMFKAGFPALDDFRKHVDPGMSSTFWRRMNL